MYGSEFGPDVNSPWIRYGSQPDDRMGSSVAGVGDVNGDGYDNFLIGAPNSTNTFGDAGIFFLYLGSSTGPDTTWYLGVGGPGSSAVGTSVAGEGAERSLFHSA
jgi:hypothetical protein